MFLLKRITSFIAPLVLTQLFWLILINPNWYYAWLFIFLFGSVLEIWFIIGTKNREVWSMVAGQLIVVMIMPAVALTLVSSVILQALGVLFLLLTLGGYTYHCYEKYLVQRSVKWWPVVWLLITKISTLTAIVVGYGLIEFLNFNVWLTAFLISLVVGWLNYFKISTEESWVKSSSSKVASFLKLDFLSHQQVAQLFWRAAIFSLITLELFLIVWLWPIVFYLKAFLVMALLVFWDSRPDKIKLYLWKWIFAFILLILILLAGEWF